MKHLYIYIYIYLSYMIWASIWIGRKTTAIYLIGNQACTGMEELIGTQPFKRSIMTFLLTRPEWWVRGRPSFTHSSYFSRVHTMSLKSGLFEGFADQQRFIRWASAGWQLAGSGGLSFCSKSVLIIKSLKVIY